LARNAGFGLVGSFTEKLVNTVINTYHASLITPLQAALPPVVTSGGTKVTIAGSVTLLPPSVTLRTNPKDLIKVSIGFSGQIDLSGGPKPGTYGLILATTLEVGVFAQVITVGSNQVITVGIDLSKASVDSVSLSVFLGNPLDPVYEAALTSHKVLDALTATLRSIPAALLQITPAGLQLPVSISKTYPRPGKPPASDDQNLFTIGFVIGRVVVRPLDSHDGKTGALVVGVDLHEPAWTTGDASALVDLNTVPSPGGYVLSYESDGTTSFNQILFGPHDSDFASAFNSDVLTQMVNGSPVVQSDGSTYIEGGIDEQVSQKFITPQVAFANPTLNDGYPPSYDCLNLQFGSFVPSFGGSPISGLIVKVHVTFYLDTEPGGDGYPIGIPNGNIDATATLNLYVRGNVFNREPPQLPAQDPPVANVILKSSPGGGYLYVEGGLVLTGQTLPLSIGKLDISADPTTFSSWSTSGKVKVDQQTSVSATLTVKGDGTLTVKTKYADPFLTQDYWAVPVDSVDIALPWWVTLVNILLPIYEVVAVFADFLGRDIWLPDIIASTEQTVSGTVEGGIAGAVGSIPMFDHEMVQAPALPGTSAPPWFTELSDIVASSEGLETYIKTGPETGPSLLVAQGGGAFTEVQGPSMSWDVHDLGKIKLRMKVPKGLIIPNDPSVYATWTVHTTDTGSTVLSQTLSLAETSEVDPLEVSIDHASAGLQAAAGFLVKCRLFQPLGTSTSELFNAQLTIEIADHFDRRHPYVQWGPHYRFIYPGAPFFNAAIQEDLPGAKGWRQGGPRWRKKTPKSRIHRTDFWNGGRRCLVAETSGFGNHLGRKLAGSGLQDTEAGFRGLDFPWIYLDTLPVTLEKVRQDRNAARGILCDYCFFGGPSKGTLRNDFPG
jgi:hypothetical protein